MFSEKYRVKAQTIFDESRRAGARADSVSYLEAETINMALMETLASYGGDEAKFDSVYAEAMPRSRQLLVNEFVKVAGYAVQEGDVNYRSVIESLKENEKNGGRGLYEPRTVLGESKLIATALGIMKDGGKLDKDSTNAFIRENLEKIFERLVSELR